MSTSTLTFADTRDRVGIVECPQDLVDEVLVIDPRPASVVERLRASFGSDELRIRTAGSSFEAIKQIRCNPPALILLDLQMSDHNGLELHRDIHRTNPDIPVIFVAHTRSAQSTIAAMKQGAYDVLHDPIDARLLHRTVTQVLTGVRQRGRSDARQVLPTPHEIDGELCGTSPAMREVYKSIGLVSGQDVNVLITGESGTGKELIARSIVRNSSRAEGPFLALNCAAIPENLLESELFGHEKGAFSGADRRRVGKFEQCDGGTILLDEIGDMPPSLQAKILRLIQEQSFERVGGNQTIKTNVRVLASTHRDLKTWAAEGKFRADLYYRLSVFSIHLPPLRERNEDISILAQRFLQQYGHDMDRPTRTLSTEAMEVLTQYPWPGNIRELQSVIRQALLRANGPVLLPAHLPEFDQIVPKSPAKQVASTPVAKTFDLDQFIEQNLGPTANDLYAHLHRELDKHALRRVLTYTRGNQLSAAKVLGIARQTLRMKLRESGLHVTQSVQARHETSVTMV